MLSELYKLKKSESIIRLLFANSINTEVAKLLRQLARYSDNVWKSNSYTRAAESIQNLKQPITEIDNLKSIEGVGKDINDEIREYLETGTIKKLEGYKEKAEEKRPFTIDDIIEKTKPLWDAADKLGLTYELTGSVRRKEEHIRDIDAIVLLNEIEEWKKLAEELDHFKAKGDQVVDFDMNGVDVNLRAAKPEEWESVVLYFTGPGSHTIYMRQQAQKKGYKLNRHGLFKSNGKLITTKEKEIFKALDMPWAEPEDR